MALLTYENAKIGLKVRSITEPDGPTYKIVARDDKELQVEIDVDGVLVWLSPIYLRPVQ